MNADQELHWPASDPHPTHHDLWGFDPGSSLAPGQRREFQFTRAGEWRYHDHLAPHRRGVVVVRERAQPSFLGLLIPSTDLSWQSLTRAMQNLILRAAPMLSPAPAGPTASPPELAELLAERDPVRQAKIVRRMAERYGPRETLGFMVRSGLPFTGETHLLVHEIGNVAYERYGQEALKECDDSFLSACYHAVILNELGDHGLKGLGEMVARCGQAGPHVLAQCSHAAGHGFLASSDYEFGPALASCDQLTLANSAIPLFNCLDGVFMENIFGVHGGAPSPKRLVRAEDPFYPCNIMPERYQPGCWANQATLMYQLFGGDLRQVAKRCGQVSKPTFRDICYGNFARQIHPLTQGQTERAIALCANADDPWRDRCLITLVSAAFSVGDRERMPYELCAELGGASKNRCYEELFGLIAGYADSPTKKSEYCGFVREADHRERCRARFGLMPTAWEGPDAAREIERTAKAEGSREAYRIIKLRWSRQPLEAHDLAHLAGRLAYSELGRDGLGVCDAEFAFGCFHGLLEEMIRQEGVSAIGSLRQYCGALAPAGRAVSCLHGIGHGVMAWHGNIGEALKACQRLAEREQAYCRDGAFMEFYTGMMSGSSRAKRNDAMDAAFCERFPADEQPECVRNHTLASLSAGNRELPTIIAGCSKLDPGIKPFCVRSIGLWAGQQTRPGTTPQTAVSALCDLFPAGDDAASCFSAAAGEMVFQGQPAEAAALLCAARSPEARRDCLNGIEAIRADYGR